MKYKKVVIWGHFLHSHTHSYVHNAFYRAFKHLGYDTYWFNDDSNVSGFDFTDCLFLTEGQVCKRMPVVATSTYILHNCYDESLWDSINKQGVNYIKLQTYTDDVLKYSDAKLLEPCIYHDAVGKIMYMCWATDLLPHEIKIFNPHKRTNKVWWVGSIGGGTFGNMEELAPFIHACKDNGIAFEHANNLSIEENQQRIAESYMAPAIVGAWQREKFYVPCRIFKNISYGQLGGTNSLRVYELFEKRIVYSPDEYELFNLMNEKINSPEYESELAWQIKFVKEHHTYINRINTLLSVLT